MAEDVRTRRTDADASSPEASEPAGPTEEALTRGRSAGTPFVLLGSVALTVWTVLALVTGAVLLVWWLT